jgi:hypothetical protein
MHPARETASWFRTRDGRRFGLEFALIVGVKLTLLTLIWVLCFRPYARPDTSPSAVRSHLIAPPESAQ